ncbi:MAG: bL17 family ribosomal protein [Candidatus Dojkabacteria bacterium]
MYNKIGVKKLGRKSSHRKALVQNQIRSLVKNGSIKTTTVKAKVVKGEIESLILKTVKREGDLNVRRVLEEILGNRRLVEKFMEFCKKGDSKVLIRKVGFRDGDNSEMSQIVVGGLRVKKSKRGSKAKVEEKKVEEKKEPVKRNILNLGAKKVLPKKAEVIKKERAKSRSGL